MDVLTKSNAGISKTVYNYLHPSALSGKNISLADGSVYYVTATGYAKPYPDTATFKQIAGLHGCPLTVINTGSASLPDNLTRGSPMEASQSCGLEGQNVQVTATVFPSAASKPVQVGCTSYRPEEEDGTNLGILSKQACAQTAMDQGYSYFGLAGTDSQNVLGSQTCMGYKATPTITMGINVLWSTNTTGSNLLQIYSDGHFAVVGTNWGRPVKYASPIPSPLPGGPFYLVLDDNGELSVRSAYLSNGPPFVWNTPTTGMAHDNNEEWEAPNGAPGINYLVSNGRSYLFPGEWMGSPNGTCRLVMETSGNLVLYTSNPFYVTGMQQCILDGSGAAVFGGYNSEAMYKLPLVGNPEDMWKHGYVTEDGQLFKTNTGPRNKNYTDLMQVDIWGNDIGMVGARDLQSCKDACSANNNCAGTTYQNQTQRCWIKHKVGAKTYDRPGLISSVRQTDPPTTGCGENIKTVSVDSVQWGGYKQTTDNSLCSVNGLLSSLQTSAANANATMTNQADLQRGRTNSANSVLLKQTPGPIPSLEAFSGKQIAGSPSSVVAESNTAVVVFTTRFWLSLFTLAVLIAIFVACLPKAY